MKSRWTVACIALALAMFAGQGAASAAFHTTEGEAGRTLSGMTNNVVIGFLGLQMGCGVSQLLGETTGGAPNTQNLVPTFSNCYGWGHWTVNTKGCKFRFDQFEDATLHGCANGRIELTKGAPLNTCTVLVPNQTVPVSYENGPKNTYLEISFASAQFTGKLTQAIGQCPLPKGEKDITVSLWGDFKVASVDGYWFDPVETVPSEFHTVPSAPISGYPVGDETTFEIGSGETVTCEVGRLQGTFPESTSAEALGELAVSPATGSCESNWLGEGMTIDATGCRYELHASGTTDLESCSEGGMVITTNIPFFVKCKIFIPNQNGVSNATYRNHGVNGLIGVRATLDLALSGKVTETSGFCPYGLGEEVNVSQESVTDFYSWVGLTQLWFG